MQADKQAKSGFACKIKFSLCLMESLFEQTHTHRETGNQCLLQIIVLLLVLLGLEAVVEMGKIKKM